MLDVCQYQFMSKYIDGYKQGTENSVLTTLTHGKQHPLNNILVFWQKKLCKSSIIYHSYDLCKKRLETIQNH